MQNIRVITIVPWPLNLSKLLHYCCNMHFLTLDYKKHCRLNAHIVPVARLEAFRALKSIGQIGGVQGPKTLQIREFQGPKILQIGHFLTLKSIGQIGGFQGPKRHISSQNHYLKKENNLNRFLGILMIYLDSQGSWAISGKL